MNHDSPVAIFGSCVPAHWLPGMKLSPFSYVFSQACVPGRARDKIVMKNDIWSDPETYKLRFILKYSAVVV